MFGKVLVGSVTSMPDIARLCGRSFSGMPSAITEMLMMLYCDPYSLRDRHHKVPERD